MAEAGFDYAELGEPQGAFDARLNALILPLLGAAQPVPGSTAEPIVLNADQQAELDALRDDEIAVAVVDQGCVAPFVDELGDIERRYELKFIDENAAVLQDLAG